MFVTLSKSLDVLFSPLTWALVPIVLSLFPRFANARGRLVALGLAILCFFAIEPVSTRLVAWTELPLRTEMRAGVTYDAVIILGGVADEHVMRIRGAPAFTDAIDRVIAAHDVYRSGRARRILVSAGGSFPPEPSEAQVIARLLEGWGVPPGAIVIEESSVNTYENALFSSRIAHEQGWEELLLVTSAAHMPRAERTFRAVGLDVDTLAVDVHASDTHWRDLSWFPRAGTLAESTEALRELAGRLVYRATE